MQLPEEAGDEHAGLVSRTASRSALGWGSAAFLGLKLAWGLEMEQKLHVRIQGIRRGEEECEIGELVDPKE